jgi:hypothetical protein
VLSGVFLGMLVFSWGKWPDVLVDFGREAYVAWQLGQGKLLGRDLEWYVAGPLSPYLNALLFRAFGPGLWVLFGFNLALLALLTWLLHCTLRDVAGAGGATAGGCAFLLLFAFGQYVGIGNYNYVAPYSHGMTHGLVLAFGCLRALAIHGRTGSPMSAAVAGALFGLCLLTKIEPALACAASATAGFAWIGSRRREKALRAVLGFGGATALSIGLALGLLLLRYPLHSAWEILAKPWILAWQSGASGNAYYLHGSGLDHPRENLAALGRWLAVYAAVLGVPFGLEAFFGGRHGRGAPAFIVTFVASAAAAWLLVPAATWWNVARPLPAVALACLAAFAAGLPRPRDAPSPSADARQLTGLMWSALALAALLKMSLNARIYHYGFALAMPAAVLLVALVAGAIPEALRAWRGGGELFRGVALGTAAAVAASHLQVAAAAYGRKEYAVGSGRDFFWADGRGYFVSEMLHRIRRIAPSRATLAVLPEGVMINYLARLPSTVPYLSFLSDSLAYYGSEIPILESYLRSPPDLIVLVHRDSSEYGPRFFGTDYGVALAEWIARNYVVLDLLGAPPLRTNDYGMLLLARRAPDAR